MTADSLRSTRNSADCDRTVTGGSLGAVALCWYSPAAFPPTVVDGNYYMDGGTVRNLNIEDAITWCKNQGFEEKEIVVDSILCTNKTLKIEDNSEKNALEMLLRYNEIGGYWSALHYIEDVKHFHPDVTIRYVVGPS